jgi:hypothetical protein
VVENALDVMQLLDVVPFRIDGAALHEAQLAIDVGYDRRYQALSLLVMREQGRSPDFKITRKVEHKPDSQHEVINPRLLSDQIVELFNASLPHVREPLESLLIIRDGRLGGQEVKGIDEALKVLIESGKLSPQAQVDLVELHKDTLKNIRLWEVDSSTVRNPLEGSLIQLNGDVVVLASTGAATLHQGTADPLQIVGGGRCARIIDAARSIFAACQLNWSSPRKAQRLPLPLKVTDEELDARLAQEIRRIR